MMMQCLRTLQHALAVMLCLGLLVACATQPSVDMNETELRSQYGEAALVIKLASGTRWFYTSGPLGVTTYAVDINNDRIAAHLQNVLTDSTLEKIVSGIAADEVLVSVGPPCQRVRFDNLGATAWDYRYRDTWGYTVEFSVMIDDTYRVISRVLRRIESIRSDH